MHNVRYLLRPRHLRWMPLLISVAVWMQSASAADPQAARPNILIAIADDHSFPHTSAYGTRAVATPAFDRVARDGILFRNAFTPAPGCSPMRAALLTGRYIWQIAEAGTHASSFPASLPVFPDHLEQAGYFIGYTGKGWSPGNFCAGGRDRNPAGPAFDDAKLEAPDGVRNTDYAANFAQFLQQKPDDQPFYFWYGGSEPHRGYKQGIGQQNGIDPAQVDVPPFLPDSPTVRGDIADYLFEIQWFDQHLGRMLETLRQSGQLENTLVIVTSDNGMPFPRAKANLYEYGIHMPLAVSWPARVPGGRVSDALVNLIDLTATIYDATGAAPAADAPPSGHSLLPLLQQDQPADDAWPQDAVFSGRERHSSSRYNSLGYPCRCIRTAQHLYIRNYFPERWPAGAPQSYANVTYTADGQVARARLGSEHGGYHDIDGSPTLTWMIENRDQPGVGQLLQAAVARRPRDELYDVVADPGCLNNLADDPQSAELLQQLSQRLEQHLRQTGDLRELDPAAAHVWETYPRYSSLRWFPTPDWAQQRPQDVPHQPWLEQQRPRAGE